MLDFIILLTGSCEQSALAEWLLQHNPDLSIMFATTLAELEAISASVLRTARLIGFSTEVIVPAGILDALGHGAYNFHPGPPSYPGWAPAHFAVYDGATTFGATANRMTKQVDAGPIIAVDLFDVPPGTSVHGLEMLAYARLAALFSQLAEPLATCAAPLPELAVPWSGIKRSRRSYAAACKIPIDISKEELSRRVEAFGQFPSGMCPTITLHGFEFRVVATRAGSSTGG